jgi:hypothetical protein
MKKYSMFYRTLGSVLFLACVCNHAEATDFYVSSTHASRNDSNPGTSASAPWATFDKIKSSWGTTIKAGDTVHLARGSTWTWGAGTYWTITTGGNATSGRITIRGDDYGTGAQPMIKRTGSSPGGTFIYIQAGGYITLRDFEINNDDIGADCILVGGYGQSADVRHVSILNMTMRKIGNQSSHYTCGIFISARNTHVISNVLVEANDISGFSAHGINVYGQKTGLTQNFHQNVVVRNNRIYSPAPNRYPAMGSGIHISFGGSGNIYEYNYIEGDNSLGSIFLMNCANNESGLVIRNNVLRNNPNGGGIGFGYDGAGAPSSVVTCDIYGNVISGCRSTGIGFESKNWYSGTVNIFNNTLYGNGIRSEWGAYCGGDIYVQSQNDAITVNVRNNILVYNKSGTEQNAPLSIFGGIVTHNNNLYWRSDGSSGVAVYNKGTTYTVANVKTYETSAQNTDPLFTDTTLFPTSVTSAKGSFPGGAMPKSTSPAIDRGATLGNAYASSINLAVRPQGAAWDIGACEFTTSTVPVPTVLAAPSGLAARAQGTNQIALSWQDNSTTESGFRLEHGVDGTTFSVLATTAASVTTYIHSGVARGVTNYYRVRANSATGASDYSDVVSLMAGEVVLDDASPSFSTLSGQDAWVVFQDPAGQHYGGAHQYNHLAGTGLDVARWTFSPPAAGLYDVYAWWWASSNRPPDVPYTISSTGFTSVTFRVDQRTNGGRWNLIGSLPFSTQGVVSVSDAVSSGVDLVADAVRLVYRSAAVPSVPAGPVAPSNLTASVFSSNSVSLSWTDRSGDETGFRIERSTDGSAFQQVGATSSNVTVFAHTGVALLSTNYYRVNAFSASGTSPYSDVVLAVPGELILDNTSAGLSISANQDPWVLYQEPAGKHFAGSHLYNRLAGGGQDSATWSFTVFRGTYDLYAWWWEASNRPPDSPYVVMHANGVTTNRVNQRINGGQWNLLGSYPFISTGAVMVTDGFTSGSDAMADAIRLVYRSAFVSPVQPPPEAPSQLAAVASSPTQITLSWVDNSTDETGFKLERGTNPTAFTLIALVSSNRTSYANTGLVMNVTYYYRLRAYNAAGDSTFANVASATTPVSQLPPSVPTGLSAMLLDTNRIALTWADTSAGETGFRIERSMNGLPFTQIAMVGANVTNYTDSGVVVTSTNAYRIKAYSSAGESAYSTVATVTLGELIIDNTSAGFSTVSGQDPWILYQDLAGLHYGGSHVYNAQLGTGLDVATWSFAVPLRGMYEVYAWWWQADWRPTDVMYIVNHASGATPVLVDQRTNGGAWVSMGVFPFVKNASVTVSDIASGGSAVVADAVRIVFRPDIPFTIPLPPTNVRVIP